MYTVCVTGTKNLAVISRLYMVNCQIDFAYSQNLLFILSGTLNSGTI